MSIRRTRAWLLPASMVVAGFTVTVMLSFGLSPDGPLPPASPIVAHAPPASRPGPAVSLPDPPPSPAKDLPPDLLPGFDQFTRLRHMQNVAAADAPSQSHRLFNARSCAECHHQAGVGGGGPGENNVRLFNKAFSANDPELVSHFGPGVGVAVLHRYSTAPQYAEWRLALIERFAPHNPEVAPRVKLRTERLSGQAKANGLFCMSLDVPPPFQQRNTPPLFGLGRIESIPQSAIDAVAESQPAEIRGRSPRVAGGGRGRFGWKSSTATLAAFNENACAVELGLSTARFKPATFNAARIAAPSAVPTAPPSTRSQLQNSSVPKSANSSAAESPPDMSDADLAHLNRFVATLPAPRQVIPQGRQTEVAHGERHFHAVGCAACHRPDLGGVEGLYSDLLLHAVGTSGGGFYGGPASPSNESSPNNRPSAIDVVRHDEFRTPPLWGVADSPPYLHDGSAATIADAIIRHRGQALKSLQKFQALANHERSTLLDFLESLRAP